jgi:hypothetical protein
MVIVRGELLNLIFVIARFSGQYNEVIQTIQNSISYKHA